MKKLKYTLTMILFITFCFGCYCPSCPECRDDKTIDSLIYDIIEKRKKYRYDSIKFVELKKEFLLKCEMQQNIFSIIWDTLYKEEARLKEWEDSLIKTRDAIKNKIHINKYDNIYIKTECGTDAILHFDGITEKPVLKLK